MKQIILTVAIGLSIGMQKMKNCKQPPLNWLRPFQKVKSWPKPK